LRRAEDEHPAVLLGERDRDLPFEVEVILPAELHRALQAAWRRGEVLRRRAAHERARGRDEASRGDRLADAEDRRKRLIVDARLAGRAPRGIVRIGDHEEKRLARVLHEAVGEDRIVLDDGPAVVRPRMSFAVKTAATPGDATTAERSRLETSRARRG
jgi:hypothetical protein